VTLVGAIRVERDVLVLPGGATAALGTLTLGGRSAVL